MGENKTPWPGRSPRWQKQHCGMVMAQKQANGIKKSSKQNAHYQDHTNKKRHQASNRHPD
jgi:hypothetical protein